MQDDMRNDKDTLDLDDPKVRDMIARFLDSQSEAAWITTEDPDYFQYRSGAV